MSNFEICNIDPFVAEVTPQSGSLEEAASTQEILIQQVENYLQRMKSAICSDLASLTSGATTFLELTDTPSAYTGAAGDVATVNAGETALEFTTPAAGSGLPDLATATEVASGRQVQTTGALENSYFKLIDLGGLPNTANKLVAHGIARPFTVVSMWGCANDPIGLVSLPLGFVTTGAAANNVMAYVNGVNIDITTGTNRIAYTDAYVILEYVKS